MHWHKSDMWKAGIAIAGMLLLLVLMVWVSVSSAGAHERASGLAGPVKVTTQPTPTANSTITSETANEQLRKLQRDNDRSWNAWFWNNGAALISSMALALAAILAIFRYFSDRSAERDRRKEEQDRWLKNQEAERDRRKEEQDRWLKNQEAERERRAEERFQAAVTGLGDEREGAKVGAAILLRTFLRPGYEQFYTQTFDLAVAHLRLPSTSSPTEDPDGIPHPPEDPNTLLPLTTLRQALIIVFKEAFPLARSQNKGEPQSLNARGIQLDRAYLYEADLEQVWMPEASLRDAFLNLAKLNGAYLYEADLSGAIIKGANLSGVFLNGAKLNGAKLNGANLSGAILRSIDSRINPISTDLSDADLSDADLSDADLRGADLRGVSLEYASYLIGTDLRGVKGLTKEQLEACKAKGAIIDVSS